MTSNQKILIPFMLFSCLSCMASVDEKKQIKKSGLSLAIDAIKQQNNGQLPPQQSTPFRFPTSTDFTGARILYGSRSHATDYRQKISDTSRNVILRCSPVADPTQKALRAVQSKEALHCVAMDTLSSQQLPKI